MQGRVEGTQVSYYESGRLKIYVRECSPALSKGTHLEAGPGGGRVRSLLQARASSCPVSCLRGRGCAAIQNHSLSSQSPHVHSAPSSLFSHAAQGSQSGPVFSLPASICRGDRAGGTFPRDTSERCNICIIRAVYAKPTYARLPSRQHRGWHIAYGPDSRR